MKSQDIIDNLESKSQPASVSDGKLEARKVFVGLSGGVDSAVSAALLKEQGFDVTGVFIKAWAPPGYPCTWREDRRSAMRAAAILDIPFITLDLEKEYKQEVVDYMLREYKAGRTPNPDVMCNKTIKFGAFLKFALKNGADFVATGHYAQKLLAPSFQLLEKNKNTRSQKLEARSYILSEAKDKNKDQSYFLWTLTQEQLKHILFPVGHLEKSQVRKLAEKFGLPQATRKDSQGICFLGRIDMKEFLSLYIKSKKGHVLNEDGEKIGDHMGAMFFTLGERHGFNITKKGNLDKALYVVDKNIKQNTITVSSKQAVSKGNKQKQKENILVLSNINVIDPELKELLQTEDLVCRFRYRQVKVECKIKNDDLGRFVVIIKNTEPISEGQSLVLYHNDQCLGGGIIEKVIR